MKKIFNLFALVLCFTAFTVASAVAQGTIKNGTDCSVRVKVAYGIPGACSVVGTATAVVAPNSAINIGIPAGLQILYAKGKYLGVSGCVFYIGQCGTYPLSDWVTCGAGCGDYGAKLYPTAGIKISN